MLGIENAPEHIGDVVDEDTEEERTVSRLARGKLPAASAKEDTPVRDQQDDRCQDPDDLIIGHASVLPVK